MAFEARYRTAPAPITGMPPGIPYIVGNEAAERYSYYGMRAILVIFMTKFLMNANGELDVMTDEQAKTWFHVFVTAVYFFPIFGAIISDAFFGKYRTILVLSIVYCLGHLTLAIDDTRTGLALGLGLIAIGSGGIKPCVSAHVGDQFGQTNARLLPKVFGWFSRSTSAR
jgi:POT family proton-dependent oligopeptide transporter